MDPALRPGEDQSVNDGFSGRTRLGIGEGGSIVQAPVSLCVLRRRSGGGGGGGGSGSGGGDADVMAMTRIR